MGIFIRIEINQERCVGVKACGLCIRTCPVKIFGQTGDRPFSIDDNEDECTLCTLCLTECKPNAIRLRKLYESEEAAVNYP